MKFLLNISLIALTMLCACGQEKTKEGKVVDTPTTGNIRLMADEAYKPIVETSIDVFDTQYVRAGIEAIYVSEGEAVKALVTDSIQVIIISRQLTADELVYFSNRGFKPKTTPIAHDALAIIVHPDNPDTVFTMEQVRRLINGEFTNWSAINPKSKLGDVRLVFDNPTSGLVRYAKDSIASGTLAPKASALNINEEVIKYVSQQKNALGIIGANWISDTDDKGAQQFLKDIQLVDVAREPGAEGFGPYQAYLATGDYPYKRTVYIIDAQARIGLGQGFASFLAGDQGQRIMLKDGLLPAQAPTRLVKTSKE
ncbi:MAG: PstS family phosphate ABC transporter substrate-binding protein [Saprospiraceae bacterium]